MTLKALIVDDEPLARERIRQLLAGEEDVELVGECKDGEEAVVAIELRRPDVVFLDVRMPKADGLEVVAALDPGDLPSVIFVTAYDEYALRAFEVHALDYLLKPVSRERFAKALERVRDERRRSNGDLGERLLGLLDDLKEGKPPLERLCVRSGGRIVFLKTREIDWIDGAGNYVRIHAAGEAHLMRSTLGGMAARLDPDKFVRVHRSTIVNVDRVRSVETTPAGDHVLILEEGQRLTVGRSHRQGLERILGNG